MIVDRRAFLGRGATLAAGALALTSGLAAAPALAMEASAAESHVAATIEEVLALVQSGGSTASKAGQLRRIMEARASVPEIARASAGAAWRQMNADQQARYTDAFADYIATIYARRFQEYNGQRITVDRSRDAGNKGILVQSLVANGGAPIIVEWLVSDRSGRVAINDIIIEGVSLVLTQRDEIGSMLNARGGDVDRLIEAMRSV